jgi:biotin carboxyl carrier protein
MPTDPVVLRLGDQEVEATCTVDPSGLLRIRLNKGEPLTVRPLTSGTYQVSQGDHSWLVRAAADGDRCWIFINGQVVVVTAQEKTARRRAGNRGTSDIGHSLSHALTVPMPATVTKLFVAEGQTVKKGQPLIMLEAMKTEFAMNAPAPGIIQKINCKERDVVQPETPLIEFRD